MGYASRRAAATGRRAVSAVQLTIQQDGRVRIEGDRRILAAYATTERKAWEAEAAKKREPFKKFGLWKRLRVACSKVLWLKLVERV